MRLYSMVECYLPCQWMDELFWWPCTWWMGSWKRILFIYTDYLLASFQLTHPPWNRDQFCSWINSRWLGAVRRFKWANLVFVAFCCYSNFTHQHVSGQGGQNESEKEKHKSCSLDSNLGVRQASNPLEKGWGILVKIPLYLELLGLLLVLAVDQSLASCFGKDAHFKATDVSLSVPQ